MNLSRNRRIVFALAAGALLALATMILAFQPGRAAGPWYVSPDGDDGNNCLSPATPCATINGAIGKASPGDTINVAVGTYTGTGDEVVLLDKDATLSGGWDETFATQSGRCTVDGEDARRGITVNSGVTAVVERFAMQNGKLDYQPGGGVYSAGTLTLNTCTVRASTSYYWGGGINNTGTLTLNNSTISDNVAYYANSVGGGIRNYGTVILNSSTVSNNRAAKNGGGMYNGGTLTLNNSTVSGNTARTGGGIYNGSTLTLNSSTVSGNEAIEYGGGIHNDTGAVALKNSILAGNMAGEGPDCWVALGSLGYNLIGDTSGCTFTPGVGDLTNISANLGLLIGSPGSPRYHPLFSSSPAIDAGDPTGCTDDGGAPLDTDQRGAPRVGRCDIGSYEYTVPGPAASIYAFGGTPQYAPVLLAFDAPLQAAVLDSIGTPVSSVLVTFSAPESSTSGTFADSGTATTTAVTGETGVATAATFTANALAGSYEVTATASGVATPATFVLGNIGWYVAPGGDDANDCQTPATPCATVNGVLGKAGFSDGDTVLVASGTYTGTGDEVVLLEKSTRLVGGWNDTFTTQSGTSTVDGEGARRSMTVNGGVTAYVERFAVHNGSGGGIANNEGTLTLNNCTVSGNTAWYRGGGIDNGGSLTLNNCTVSGNTASVQGGGIYNNGLPGTLALNNSTVSGNSTSGNGGGIYSDSGAVTLQNTIVAGNAASGTGPDCSGTIGSLSYNLLGDTSGCTFMPGAGDLTNVSANLGLLIGSRGYHPLLAGSPAIDAVPLGQCTLSTDQRGVSRPQGAACDMGAYEHTNPGPAVSISAAGGTPQYTPPSLAFDTPLQAAVLDNVGTPVSNTPVTFSAPASGASGIFADSSTYATTAVTDAGGVATAATFTANALTGSYAVTATASGIVTPATFLLSNTGWYVAPYGSDSNNCQTAATPCATVNGALGKTGFAAGDMVLVGTGTYTGSGNEVVLLDKDATLSGGWDVSFTSQSGTSTIDGQGARRGITVNEGVTAIVERFTVQGGWATEFPGGGGIYNSGLLTLNDSFVRDNAATENTNVDSGGGIQNHENGILILNNSTVSGNEASDGGGISGGDAVILNNSTVSGNEARNGGGINGGEAVILNNSTISGNTAESYGGGIRGGNTTTLNNSTVSGNTCTGNGAGLYLWAGTLTLNSSTVSDNHGARGIHNYSGNVNLNNSTVSGNDGGGIFNSAGTLNLNSSTVSRNTCDGEGGGIWNWGGTATLQNTLVAGNVASGTGPDCSGEIGSFGYNLVGDTSDCTFASTIGDLGDTDAKLFSLFGLPGYHALLPGSPAIDAGNPAGCTDHLGNSLTTDQRGLPRPIDGDGDGDAICDIGSYEFDPEHTIRRVFLPVCTRNFCAPGFFDDFSNPASGWPVVDDSYVRTEYLDGEYRVLTKQSGYFYLFSAPACDRQNYTVEADVRWDGPPGSSYGLIFGVTGGYGQYYLFDMNTDSQQYRLLRRDPSGFVYVVPVAYTSAINAGSFSNHLKVTRSGDGITLEVNGTVLGTWYDGTIGGLTGAGVVTNPYSDTPTSDARFDNFSMVTLLGGGALVPDSRSVTPDEIEFVAPNARRDPVPADMAW